MRSATLSRRCSQLSRYSRVGALARWWARASRGDSVAWVGASIRPATAAARSVPSARSASSATTTRVPTPSTFVATSDARLVLPIPPGPSTVTNLTRVSNAASPSTSWPRPTKLLARCGIVARRPLLGASAGGAVGVRSWRRIATSSSDSRGVGSTPNSLSRWSRKVAYTASASGCRPRRYSVSISNAADDSRSGRSMRTSRSVMIAASTFPAKIADSARASSKPTRSSRACSRAAMASMSSMSTKGSPVYNARNSSIAAGCSEVLSSAIAARQ